MKIDGTITCDSPNEYLEKWDGNLTVKSQKKSYTFNAGYYILLIQLG